MREISLQFAALSLNFIFSLITFIYTCLSNKLILQIERRRKPIKEKTSTFQYCDPRQTLPTIVKSGIVKLNDIYGSCKIGRFTNSLFIDCSGHWAISATLYKLNPPTFDERSLEFQSISSMWNKKRIVRDAATSASSLACYMQIFYLLSVPTSVWDMNHVNVSSCKPEIHPMRRSNKTCEFLSDFWFVFSLQVILS